MVNPQNNEPSQKSSKITINGSYEPSQMVGLVLGFLSCFLYYPIHQPAGGEADLQPPPSDLKHLGRGSSHP